MRVKLLSWRVALLLFLAGLTGPGPALATTIYGFAVLDVPGANSTAASGINDVGQIVGSYTDASGTHGFVRNGTVYTSVDFPGASSTVAAGINNAGEIVGSFGRRGFSSDGGTYTPFDVPWEPFLGHALTTANGINDAGRIVGATDFMTDSLQSYWTDGPNSPAWVVFAGGPMTTSVAFDINDAGQIVGNFGEPGFQASYLLDGAAFTTFQAPDALETYAYGINDPGQIVGSLRYVFPGAQHGYVKDGDTYTPLDVPDAVSTVARGINDAGWIVGAFTDAAGVTHGFLATPLPEPTSLWLLSLGLAGLSAWRRWRPTFGAR